MVIASKMAWIAVSDLERARKFFTEVVGLQEKEYHPEFNWVEMEGSSENGARLGIAQASDQFPAGQGAIMTFNVPNIEEARCNLEKKGGELVGEIEEIPGHVKLQLFKDQDGSMFQLVEVLA